MIRLYRGQAAKGTARRLVRFQQLSGLILLTLGFWVGSRWWPHSVEAAEISPQLREQVLQIIREHPEVLLESIQVYQQKLQAQEQQAQQALLQQAKANPRALIGTSPTQGAPNGRVVLIEFSDFQCPFCARVNPTLKQFMAKHGQTVTLVYKHLPLTTIHPAALPAARASWAALQQGKFWEFHDALFANQQRLGDALYQEIAQSLRLDVAQFNRDRASQASLAVVQQDLALAESFGIDGTPFFIMNGQVLAGAVSLAELEAALARVK